MKLSLAHKLTVLGAGAALVFIVSPARADDPQPKHRHRAVAKKADADHVTTAKPATVDHTIPTRDGQHAKTVEGGMVGGANGPEHSVLTGSHLPQKYNRQGYNTDADRDVFIYDQNDIRLRSTNTVQDSLRSVPGLTVRGSR